MSATSVPSANSLGAFLSQQSAYVSYAYSYPHKTAYRVFDTPRPLASLWEGERRDALFYYLHIPFCEMRCGFCNLFTQARPDPELPLRYVESIERQTQVVKSAVGKATFARAAFGGGTPTLLEEPLLDRVFDAAESLGVELGRIPVSLETSPETATPGRMNLIASRGIERVSMGVQSFIDSELKSMGRPSRSVSAESALDTIRAAGIRRVNLDLIYGAGNQTPDSWLYSLESAMRWSPDEVFLYPLYVRPLTGLGKSERSWDDIRRELYRIGRDFLLAQGYAQHSMRLFRRPSQDEAPTYRCQEDGMVGLGCGARSYTRTVHYSDEWAVGKNSVKSIIANFVARPAESFAQVYHGVDVSVADQKVRYLLKSLLCSEGIDPGPYRAYFGTEPNDDCPQLNELVELDLADWESDGALRLTDAGYELSDAIGPWLYGDQVRERMAEFALR
ncbi:MAG: STM4012 family radical SAM protein [Myxococcota bacterium]